MVMRVWGPGDGDAVIMVGGTYEVLGILVWGGESCMVCYVVCSDIVIDFFEEGISWLKMYVVSVWI